MTQPKRNIIWSICLVAVLTIGFLAGHWLATMQARVDVLRGPYSDDYGPALNGIAKAKEKIANGDNNIDEELDQAQYHIQHARDWTRKFLDQQAVDENRSRPTS